MTNRSDGPPDQPAKDVESRTLGRVLRGPRALAALAPLLASAPQTLELVGTALTRVDAAERPRAAVEHHLNRDPSNAIVLREPADAESRSLLHDLVGSLPSRSTWAGDQPPPQRDRRVILPATPVANEEALRLVTWDVLRIASAALGFGDRTARLLQQAGATFLYNALAHAGEPSIPALACAGLEPQGNELQLAVLDFGPAPPEDEGESVVRELVARSRAGYHDLHVLAAQSFGGLDRSIRLAWGTGRARYRSGGPWRFDRGPYVPGFFAVHEIHR